MLMLNELVVAEALLLSVTRTLMGKVPTCLGVPVIAPVLLEKLKPVGSAPVKVKTFDPEPPVVEILKLNEVS